MTLKTCTKLTEQLHKEIDTITDSSECVDSKLRDLNQVALELEALLDHVKIAKNDILEG